MQQYNLEESIVDVFRSFITDWLDTGAVKLSKYHIRYHKANAGFSWENCRKNDYKIVTRMYCSTQTTTEILDQTIFRELPLSKASL